MATSGSSTYRATSYDSIKFSWETISQSSVSNSSTIGWKMELIASASGKIVSSSSKKWSVTINGTLYTGTNTIAIGDNETKVLASGTTDIPHNSDGTKVFSYAIEQEFGITFGGVHIGTVTGSGTGVLNTIARKSTLSAQNGTLGTMQKLTVSRQSTAFTHTITYKCGSVSGTICAKSTSESIDWTPPVELAEQAPSANSVSVQFTITTHSGSSDVGSSSVAITCAIPYNNTYVPVLMYSTSDAMGYKDKYGAYVQGQSKLSLDITTYGAYGAWITSVRTLFDGSVYTTQSVTSNPIIMSGTLPVKVVVTDSRGRQSEVETEITVLPYSYPRITSLSAMRSDELGNADSSGGYLAVRFSTEVSSLNNVNKAEFSACYKALGATAYTEMDTSQYSGNYSVTNGLCVFAADTASSYDILFSVYDDFKTTTKSTSGTSVKKVWSLLKKDGEIVGMAVNKVAEHEGYFDIGLKLKCEGDSVIEQGEIDGWTYRKWDSGIAECWKTLEHSTTVATAWGSMFVGNATARQNYPFAFLSKPVEIVTLTSGSKMGFIYPEQSGHGVNGAYASARYNVCSLSSYTSAVTYYFNYHVLGRWK